jgi:hypothetical protein
MQLGLSGGIAMIDEYVVNPPTPYYLTNHYHGMSNDKDFVIAEDISTLYSTSGGVYGIGKWDMITRTYSYWPYDEPYGAAVAIVPNSASVYGASASDYVPRIRQFNRISGAVSNTFDAHLSGRGIGRIQDRSLQVTPNGRIFYLRALRKIGLIGASFLDMTVPATAEVVDAGPDRTMTAGDSLSVTALAPQQAEGETFAWSVISGPGPVDFSPSDSLSTTVGITTPGNYIPRIARVKAGRASYDRLSVLVMPPPLLVDQVSIGAGKKLQFWVNGSCQIEASSNLIHWSVITNVTYSAGWVVINDPITNNPLQFYRARAD